MLSHPYTDRQKNVCSFRYLSLYYIRFTLSICEGKGIFKNWTIHLWKEGVWLSVCTSRREGWTTFNTIKGSCWNLDTLNSVCVMLWQRPKITWMASIVNPWAESILFLENQSPLSVFWLNILYCNWCWRNEVKFLSVLLNLKQKFIYRKI